MAVIDYNKEKKLDVASVSGTPTISHAVPIKIDDGKDPSLVAHWKLNESSGDAEDSSWNGNDGTVNGATQGATGKVGTAYDFDGTDDYVKFSNNIFDSLSHGTIIAWVNADSLSSNSRIVNLENMDYIEYVDGTGIQGSVYDGSSGKKVTLSANPLTNTWYQVAITWNGSTEIGYLDGSQVDSTSCGPSDIAGWDRASALAANRDGSGEFLDGKIDDVRIYNRALSSSEIQALYNSGNGTESGLQTDSSTGTGNLALDWTNISAESDLAIYDENDNLLDYYVENFSLAHNRAVIHTYRAWTRDGSTQAKVAYGSGPSDNSVAASTVFDKEGTNSNLVSGWLLNETSGDALDVTSNNNDGTVTGATQDVAGQIDGAYDFDGTDDYIEVPFGEDGSSRTIVAWAEIDTTDTGNNNVNIYNTRDGGTSGGLSLAHNDNNGIKFAIADSEGATWTSTYSISANTWYFFVATYDSSTGDGKLYIDGDFKETITRTVGSNAINNRIGDAYGWPNQWDGKIDDVRIYDSALSSSEITAKFDASKSAPSFFSQQAASTTFTGDISGTITLDGSGITAIVYAYNKTTSTFIDKATALSNGSYSFSDTGSPGDIILIAVDYDDGDTYGDEKSIVLG